MGFFFNGSWSREWKSICDINALRALGIINLIYWYANLLFFLIPVGVVRYLRAHYFCVEAEEVTVRKGGESSVGLLP